MHKKSSILSLLLLVFLAGFSQNPSNSWMSLTPNSYELLGSYRGIPAHYTAFSLDASDCKSFLTGLPMEEIGRLNGKNMLIPYPDGSFKKFEVVESPIMEAGLAVKFPEIKTYVGKGIDDPYASIRFSMTPLGFHAIIHGLEETIYIDPYPAVNQQIYFSYYKKDYQAVKSFAEASLPQDPGTGNTGPILPLRSGQTLRTYRIAIATTGEYAAFHGGNLSSTMSAIVTTLNRVNSVYELEFAIRLILVNNNDQIIYLNANTDPFTNTDPNSLISENQTTIDAQIGSANYDIGHVFSTGGGGLASAGVVCRSGAKANGVTGTNSPIGDPYDIDFVAHEIGHQFNASHTFNSRRSSCQGNRVASSAYEPGSGSTIMGYAGLCSSDNLQINSNAYFHARSYDQIMAYVVNGNGNTCGTSMATGNTPPNPVIKVGNTTIPMMTPFELEGSASDVDGDNLTFCWEQYDLGPSGSPNSPAGDAPIFRSFSPDDDSIRIFPNLENILGYTNSFGEILPTYSRNLNFRLTVRDNHVGGGGVEFASTQFTVTNQAGPFELIFPNTSTTVWIRTANVKVPIRWNTANTEFSPVNCDSVEISLSVDGGYTYPFTLAHAVPNTGTAEAVFPNLNTDSARVKVKAKGNVFFTISDDNFIIKLDNVAVDTDVSGFSFDLGPNPVREMLSLHVKTKERAEIRYELIDLNGRVLEQTTYLTLGGLKSTQQVNVAHYPRGIYLLKLTYQGQLFTRKVFKL